MVYVSYIMKRTQIYVTDEQDRRLSARARAAGVTKSTLIREAIETYLTTAEDDAARLAAFRSALDEAEAAPATLPEGQEYVESLRASDRARDEAIERHQR